MGSINSGSNYNNNANSSFGGPSSPPSPQGSFSFYTNYSDPDMSAGNCLNQQGMSSIGNGNSNGQGIQMNIPPASPPTSHLSDQGNSRSQNYFYNPAPTFDFGFSYGRTNSTFT